MATNFDIYDTFLEYRGTPYRLGAEAKGNDLHPAALDCSEGIELSCRRNGVYIPDGAQNQYQWCKAHGMLIPVAKARGIVGALGFRINFSGPDHVVLSNGHGGTMECKGRAYGCNTFTWDGRFTHAGYIPSVAYFASRPGTTPPPTQPPVNLPPAALTSEEEDEMVFARNDITGEVYTLWVGSGHRSPVKDSEQYQVLQDLDREIRSLEGVPPKGPSVVHYSNPRAWDVMLDAFAPRP